MPAHLPLLTQGVTIDQHLRVPPGNRHEQLKGV